jgi:DNA polymerase-3 subunit delta'
MKPWIEKSLNDFDKIITQNRLPHSLIIYGNEGIGKLELAQKIVEKITSVNVSNDNLIVDDNNNILIRNSNYKGLIYCQREIAKNSKTKKASRVISVNQVRKMCDFLEKTSSQIQIGIINAGDFMHISASNALLKTLEEPKNNTLIIILANKLQNLPITILSRCQKLHLTADDDSLAWIKDNSKIEIAESVIKKLLKENDNTPNKVLEKINSGYINQEMAWKKQLLSMAINPNNINNIENIKDNELKVISCLENVLIACIEFKTSNSIIENKSLNHILQNTETKMFFNLLKDTSHAKSLAKTTVNIKLLLDNLLIVWSHITHLQDYPQITFE